MNNKRKTLQKITGGVVLATVVPDSWVRPVVHSLVLPAHAQMSVMTSVENVLISVSEEIGLRLNSNDSRIRINQGTTTGGTEFSQIVIDVLSEIDIPAESIFTIAENPVENIGAAGRIGIRLSGDSGVLWDFNFTAGDKAPIGEFEIVVKIEYPNETLNFVSFSVLFTEA